MKVYIGKSKELSPCLELMLKEFLLEIENDEEIEIVSLEEYKKENQNAGILLVCELNEIGSSLEIEEILLNLKKQGCNFNGSKGAILVHSNSKLYSKTYGQRLIFLTNELGLRFMGRPFVEATLNLENHRATGKRTGLTEEEVLIKEVREVASNFVKFFPNEVKLLPKIAVIHACSDGSNTLALWNMVSQNLRLAEVKVIHIENGDVKDCKGCSYKVCKHYGKRTSCFYGGIMVDDVYPAILESDTVVFLCPNYNDSIPANMTAVINRLTALFRKIKFYNKNFFAIIVSGHSGSDAIAKQLISALCINKTFQLPPNFAIMEIANDIGDIYKVENINERAEAFARKIEVFPWSHF